MPETQAPPGAFKPKKSVALSGVTAGNTALCTVGKTGNDLHYRGYDILDIATECEFEEIAYLLVHEKLPNRAELAAYKIKLQRAAGAARRRAPWCSSSCRPQAIPWTFCAPASLRSAAAFPKPASIEVRARATSPTGCWLAWARCCAIGTTTRAMRRRIEVQTDDDSIGAHFLHLLARPQALAVRGCAPCTPRSISTPSTNSTPRPSRRG